MLNALLRRERILVLVALLAVILLAWSYLLVGAGIEMEQMDMGGGQMMLMAPAWTASYVALIFLMWAIMMMAMMLPSAAPAVLLAAALLRHRGGDRIFGPTGLFVLGYLLIWFGFAGPLLREDLSLCRGRRLYHLHKEHAGTWETSHPVGRREPLRSALGRRGAEADDERG